MLGIDISSLGYCAWYGISMIGLGTMPDTYYLLVYIPCMVRNIYGWLNYHDPRLPLICNIILRIPKDPKGTM